MPQPLEFTVSAETSQAARDIDNLIRRIDTLVDETRPLDREMARAERSTKEMGDAARGAAQNTQLLGRQAQTTGRSIANFATQAQDFANKVLGFFVVREAIQLFDRFTDAIRRAMAETVRFGDDIATFASKTGIAAEQLQELAFVAERSDVSFSELTTAIRFSQRAFDEAAQGVEEYAEPIRRLGVQYIEPTTGKVREFADMLPELASAFNDIESPTERASLAMQIFGRAGTALLPLFEQGEDGIRRLIDRFNELGGAMSPGVLEATQAADDAMKDLSLASKALEREALAPLIERVTAFQISLTNLIVALRSVPDDVAQKFRGIAEGLDRALRAGSPFYRLLAGIPSTIDQITSGIDRIAEKLGDATAAANQFSVSLERAQRGPLDIDIEPQLPGPGFAPGIRGPEGGFAPDFQDVTAWNEEFRQTALDAEREKVRIWEEAFGQLPERMQPEDLFAGQPDIRDANDARQEEISLVNQTASTIGALSQVFDSLNSQVARTITAIADFIIRLTDLIASLRGTGAASAGISLAGAIGGGDGVQALDYMKRTAEATEAIDKGVRESQRVTQVGGAIGVAPLGPGGGQPAQGWNQAISTVGGWGGLGGLVLGFGGGLLQSLANRLNREDRERLEAERRAWSRAMQVGGPELTAAFVRRGGLVSTYQHFTSPVYGEGSRYQKGDDDDVPPPPPGSIGDRALGGLSFNINVDAMDAKSVSEFFRSEDFKSAMRFAKVTREQ